VDLAEGVNHHSEAASGLCVCLRHGVIFLNSFLLQTAACTSDGVSPARSTAVSSALKAEIACKLELSFKSGLRSGLL
jgi:hypothetical protein